MYPVGRNLQIASSPAAIGRIAAIVQRAEDHILYPVTIPVEAVPSGVNNTLVEACDGSTRTDHVLTSGVGKKDFPNGREGIRRIPITWGLSLLLGCFAQAPLDFLLKIRSVACLLIGVGGIAHVSRCPMLDGNVGVRMHRVHNDGRRSS